MGKALAESFSDLPSDVRRGRRGARRVAERALLRRSGVATPAHREHAAGDSRRQRRSLPPGRRRTVLPRRSRPGTASGEYSAHVAAGTLSFADALRTVRRRGQFMQEAVPVGEGAMSAILGADADTVGKACADARAELAGRVVSPANLNAPGQVVIAGHADAVARAGELAKAAGAKRVIPLAVSAPFHCALMKPAEDRLAPILRSLSTENPRIPVIANVDAEPKTRGRRRRRCLDSTGLVARPLGGRRQAARGGGRANVCRAWARQRAGRPGEEDRPQRDRRERRGSGRPGGLV